jgi:hypothetical protein
VDNIRVVVGFDPLNKFLQSPLGQITKSESVYAGLPSSDYMCKLDFRDMYWQLRFDTLKPRSKKKIAYLCIKTSFGTMAYTRAPMGLLSMDVF